MVRGKKVYLSSLERENLEQLRQWRNLPELRKYFREYREITKENQSKWNENRVLNNNEQVDYVKQAVYSAKLIKKHLGCGVAIASDCADYVRTGFPDYKKYIDHVIDVDDALTKDAGRKRFRDGTMAEKNLQWKNTNRYSAYDITPFDQTIVIDTDVLINNDAYNNCWTQTEDFLIDNQMVDIHPTRKDHTFKRISDKSITFYWATAFFFRKTPTTKLFFDTIQHVISNYDFYRMMYQIIPKKLRNDFVFSIAIHIMNLSLIHISEPTRPY